MEFIHKSTEDAVICLSGGMDSATLIPMALRENADVTAVSFAYPSKHNKYELRAAMLITDHYAMSHTVIDLEPIFQGFESALLKDGNDIPEGHYEASSMSQTVVPGRNMIFTSILAGLAWSRKATRIYLGIHAGDHVIYADCRPEFFYHMNDAVRTGTDEKVELRAPFLNMTKKDILRIGYEFDVPYDLTRTCYKDQHLACGKCGACQERLEAFKFVGRTDPLDYDNDLN